MCPLPSYVFDALFSVPPRPLWSLFFHRIFFSFFLVVRAITGICDSNNFWFSYSLGQTFNHWIIILSENTHNTTSNCSTIHHSVNNCFIVMLWLLGVLHVENCNIKFFCGLGVLFLPPTRLYPFWIPPIKECMSRLWENCL